MRNSFLRRILSLVVLTAIIVSNFTFELTFANLQTNVRDVVIRYVPPAGIMYNINFTWTNPPKSELNDGAAEDGDLPHDTAGYRIMERNTTNNETAGTDVSGGNLTGAALNTANVARNLVSGSIYAYSIIPFHRHTYRQNDGTIITREAPYDNSPIEEVLFMTDIEVEASGSGNTLNVIWDNPLFMGRNVFTGYRIYYQRGGTSVTNFNNYRDVSVDNEDIVKRQDEVRTGVQRFEYSIIDSSLTPGEVYAVQVEPLYMGEEIRNLKSLSYADVSINNVLYKMAFSDFRSVKYRTNDAYVSIPLEVLEDGKDYLKLHWGSISNTVGDVERIEIYKGEDETDIGVKIGTIFSPQSIYVNYWQIDKPLETTYYQLRIFVKGMDVPIESEIAVYDPNIVNITPNKPKLFVETNKNGAQNILDVYWNVFLRFPYNDNEKEFVEPDGMYIDKNVVYDLWISDSLANLEDPALPKTLSEVTPQQLTQTEIDASDTPVYHRALTTYSAKENGVYVTKNIEQNKVYYIKLVAIKPMLVGKDLTSEPAYASEYFPADGDIATPRSLNKPPLKIKQDSEGNDVITNNSIAVEWMTQWFEIYDSATDSWHSSAAVLDGGKLYFGDDAATTSGAVNFCGASSKEKVIELFAQKGLDEDTLNLIPVRKVDLTAEDIKYEMLAIPFDNINENGGYEAYLERIMNDENAGWTEITPTIVSDTSAEYNVTGLEKNTTYAVIIRPYRILPDGKKDAYPAYIMGTTLPDPVDIIVTPTVPVLEEDSHDDMSITVKWQEHMDSLEYELVYSTNLLEDPANGGTRVDMAQISADGVHTVENEIKRISYKISRLMPETGYYIWVRAHATNNGNVISSAWSNPIFVVTDELGAPDIPSGLGLVSKNSLDIYNIANEANLKQIGEDYMILEWLRNEDDLGEAGAVSNGTGYEAISDPQIQNSYVVRFIDLLPYTRYYARVKAKCAVTVDANGERTKVYSYTLEFSPNSDFKDSILAVVPNDATGGTDERFVKESDWSRVVSFTTGKSGNEIDGDKNDDHYPLPKDDFEMIYDGLDKNLTYRFRSDKEGQDGLDDNLVDQRFISRILNSKIYNYEADLTSFNNYEIKSRTIEIPYSIMEALGEHKVTLAFKADSITYTFEPDFVKTDEVKNLAGYGQGAIVKIVSTTLPSDAPILNFGQTFATPAQKLNVYVVTPSRTVTLNQFDKDVTVSMKLNDRYSLQESNVGAYYDTDLTDSWQRLDYVYDYAQGTFTGKTKLPGSYAAIKNQTPAISTNSANAVNALVSVHTKLNISDIQYVKPQAVVSTVQFNNIVAAVANGRKDVAVNGALSDADYTALSRKGIVISNATVSREEGINVLVKLYEAKTGRPVQYYSSLQQTSYKDISGANPAYQASLLKAGDLGFYKNTYSARPKDTMSFEDLLYMVDIIIRDSGM